MPASSHCAIVCRFAVRPTLFSRVRLLDGPDWEHCADLPRRSARAGSQGIHELFGHALHAPEHNAWDNYALLEAIWADPQCYRRVMGRRQGSQARRQGGAGAGGRGGAGGRDNNRNSARAGGGGKGAPSAATGAKGGEKGAKGAPAQGAAARGRGRARGSFRGQVARH